MARNLVAYNIPLFVDELRKYVQFLDCKFLKEVVREYASPDLLSRIEHYKIAVDAFCKTTCITSFIQNFNGQLKLPANFAELKAKFNIDPDKSVYSS